MTASVAIALGVLIDATVLTAQTAVRLYSARKENGGSRFIAVDDKVEAFIRIDLSCEWAAALQWRGDCEPATNIPLALLLIDG